MAGKTIDHTVISMACLDGDFPIETETHSPMCIVKQKVKRRSHFIILTISHGAVI